MLYVPLKALAVDVERNLGPRSLASPAALRLGPRADVTLGDADRRHPGRGPAKISGNLRTS